MNRNIIQKNTILHHMKRKDPKSTQGISEVTAEILIIILVVVVAMVAYAAFSGALNPLFFKKSVYIAGTAAVSQIPQPGGIKYDVLTYLPKAGDPFYLTGQTSGANGTQVTFKALSPGGLVLSPDASSLKGSLYGKTLYIYPNGSPSATQCDYTISETVPTVALRPMTLGIWTIQMIDEKVHVLANTFKETVTHGTTSLPVAGGFVGTSPSQFYDPSCNPISQTVNGNLLTSLTGPGNMTATYFNGASSITIPGSTGLGFTGDMSISMWFNPSTTSSWQQLIGKGVTTNAGSSSSNENDNYQLFQLGNQLLFEWNDATTGQHYQAITTTTPVQANTWNYVTATVNNGVLTIYDEGVAQPLAYDNSNVPGQNPVTGPVTVNLESNNNAVNIGEQNYATDPSDAFYYNGYMGSVALYNQALTLQQIAANYAAYQA
jgi:hypothetical protein